MTKKTEIQYKKVENKTIAWFKNKNQYLVLENTTAAILKQLNNNVLVTEIAKEVSKTFSLPLDETINFILELKKNLTDTDADVSSKESIKSEEIARPNLFAYTKHYQVNNTVFKINYLSEKELSLVHPKFAHLDIDTSSSFNHQFDVFIANDFIYLYVDHNFIGSWNHTEVHYFQGKFSMEFIQKIHQKEEDEWMGVFHASAVSNHKKAVLFLGDSGNGKSTSLSLLQANGYTCLADDFVPIDVKNKEVYSFPAAISIKKSSLQTLLPLYPELETTAEYHFKKLNKIVRYLKPNNTNFFAHLPCNDLVFIKYEKDAALTCHKISKIDAFQQLVPDSWLSKKEENAAIFLEWFSNLNCYQLTYSNNNKMIEAVANIFKD
ncbi:hypothetical protein [uncultured Polaribacter sp.]|uniref:hypothetical protein n=1 Tax=uncultured Polaribacter sp. TaxID=174711 RepID=UPI00260322F3|nr:hypothetical protein [uncultured Polaribacter sp.]